jgi:SAM-dependent methyltransferase
MDIEAQRAFYNDRWAKTKYANRRKLQRCIAILDEINYALGQVREPRILDIGCGDGWLTSIVSHFGPTTGIDLSNDAVEQARRRYPGVTFEAADLTQYQHSGELFDIVISQEVIEHLEDPASHLAMIHRLLKPNGCLILTTPNKTTLLHVPKELRESWSNQPIENWLTARELNQLVRQRFKLIHSRTVIPIYGSLGSRTLLSKSKLRTILHKAHLLTAYDDLLLRAHLGLHLCVLARKM